MPMRIVMFTNSYVPVVNGVTRSIQSVRQKLLEFGHALLIVAPQQRDAPCDEAGIVRLPAIPPLTANEIPLALPAIGTLRRALDDFAPTVVHAHHPFFLGNTALRVAATRNLPVVFTHHTMYEHYAHYLPGDPQIVAHLASRLATEFANRCQAVIAPSKSVAEILHQRGVVVPVQAIPTGIDTAAFSRGDRAVGRRRLGLDSEAQVIGYVGRLAAEKNLEFLFRAVAELFPRFPRARLLIVGEGPIQSRLEAMAVELAIESRVRFAGALAGPELADAYRSIDVFAFSSQSDTQGMVLAEAMAAGVPVVALDAAGAREIVRDGINGRLVARADTAEFAAALSALLQAGPRDRKRFAAAARQTADAYSLDSCTTRLVRTYRQAQSSRPREDQSLFAATRRRMAEELEIWSCWGRAGLAAVHGSMPQTSDDPSHTVF
jgi:1,2-diacylglycerol 3-alpha-glucosyltransferase